MITYKDINNIIALEAKSSERLFLLTSNIIHIKNVPFPPELKKTFISAIFIPGAKKGTHSLCETGSYSMTHTV